MASFPARQSAVVSLTCCSVGQDGPVVVSLDAKKKPGNLHARFRSVNGPNIHSWIGFDLKFPLLREVQETNHDHGHGNTYSGKATFLVSFRFCCYFFAAAVAVIILSYPPVY